MIGSLAVYGNEANDSSIPYPQYMILGLTDPIRIFPKKIFI